MLNGVRNILAWVAGVKRGRDWDYFSHPCAPLALSHASCALARSNSPFLFPRRLVTFNMRWYTVQQELQLLLIKKVKSCVTGYRYTQGLDCARQRKNNTVLCSSPSLIWKLCSRTEYMILPTPKDGSITWGSTSRTEENTRMHNSITLLIKISSTYKFSRLDSMHFLKELVERIW